MNTRLFKVIFITFFIAAFANLHAESDSFLLDKGIIAYQEKDYEKAETLFKNYLKREENSPVALKYLSQIEIERSNLPAAAKYLEQAIKAHPGRTELRIKIADIYGQLGSLDKAEEHLLAVVEQEPLNEQAIAMLALISAHQKDYHRSSGWYKRLIIATQNSFGSEAYLARAYSALGSYYYNEQDFPRSIGYYEKYFQLDPGNLQTMLILGELYKIVGDFEKSIDMLNRFLSQKKYYVPALESQAESLFILGKPEAKATAQAALSYSKKSGSREIMQGIVSYYNNDFSEAEVFFTQVLKENSSRLSAHIGMYRIYKKTDKPREEKKEAFTILLLAHQISAYELAHKYSVPVRDALDRERKEFPDIFSKEPAELTTQEIRYLLDEIEFESSHAYTLENIDHPNSALVSYRIVQDRCNILLEALENPDSRANQYIEKDGILAKRYQTMLNEAWVLQSLDEKNKDRARETLHKAQKQLPEEPSGYFIEGILFIDDDPKDSEDKLNTAVTLAEKYAKGSKAPHNYYFYRGMAREKTKGFANAESDLRTAIELDPYNSTYLNFLGYMYSQNDSNLEEAYQLLLRALEDDPQNEAYLDSFGWILYKMQHYKLALRQLNSAFDIAERNEIEDAVIYFHLAETYLALEDYNSASVFYQKTLDTIDTASENLNRSYIEKKLKEASDPGK